MASKKQPNLTDKYLAQLHKGSKASTQQNAKELRRRQTKAEEKLWSLLRNRQLHGKKFRRQHAIADYVVDFYCNESKLVIELDGNSHTEPEAKEYDRIRTFALTEMGITVLRFWNEQVLKEPARVLNAISQRLH
jgi:very-short-patch-repair endonuclease